MELGQNAGEEGGESEEGNDRVGQEEGRKEREGGTCEEEQLGNGRDGQKEEEEGGGKRENRVRVAGRTARVIKSARQPAKEP